MIGVGQQLGGYTILRKIGQGGMGDVYLAQHRRVSRRAAVKVLLPELSQKASVLDRFFNEARATSLIKHPGIVEILDCDVLDDQAFIIMEFLDGESLGSYMNRTGALSQDLPFLLGVSAAIASAVGAAHSTGIIHRDLKPDNVYLHLSHASDPTVTVKILDFGIAKLAQQEGGTSQTKTGMLLGTPAYMSPEQCRGAGQVDSRSDIYSLGCILYELVCGAPPFVHEGAGDMIIAHVSEPPEPPIARVPNMAPAMNALILRMLAKKPDQRPQTMEDVASELAELAHSIGVAADKPLRPRFPVERPPSTEQFSPTLSASGVPRSQLTPLPGGAGSIPNPTGRPVTPMSAAPSHPVSAVASGRLRTGPQAVLQPEAAPIAYVGGTRVMESVRQTTTMGSAAAEITADPTPPAPPARRGKTYAMAGGGIALVGGIIAVISLGGSNSPSRSTVPHATESAAVAAPAPEKATPTTPAEPAPTAAPKVVAPSAPETVRIDLQGVPARTVVTVDGKAVALPVELPRGTAVHHIVLKTPSGVERALDLDGSRDRLVELMFDKKASSSDDKGSRSSSGDGSHHSSSGSSSRDRPAGGKKKTGNSDRDAIIDL